MMRPLLLLLSFLSAAAFACGNPGAGCGPQNSGSCATQSQCGCGGSGKVSLLETITYAIDELGLADNGDIRTAIALYKKEMRSFEPRIPTEAFDNGAFNPEVYAKNATPAHALKAQSELFETIYLVLSDEQKKSFPQLMGMYQHHMKYAGTSNKSCGCGKGMGMGAGMGCGPKAGCCNTPKMCATPPMQGCGGKNCKAPMMMKKAQTAPKP